MIDLRQIADTIDKVRAVDKHALYVSALDIPNSLVSDEELASIEKSLGYDLCVDYKAFLQTFGFMHTRTEYFLGIIRENSVLEVQFIESTKEFFTKEFFQSVDREGRTIVCYTNDEEYFYVLEHETCMVTPFDPFAERYVVSQAKAFDQFFNDFIAEELELAKESVD